MMIDEISLLLGKRILTKVSTLKQSPTSCKRPSSPSACWKTASEGFTLDVIREDEAGNDETISIDKLTATAGADMSPIIRLVDTTISPRCRGGRATSTSKRGTIRSTSSFVSTEC